MTPEDERKSRALIKHFDQVINYLSSSVRHAVSQEKGEPTTMELQEWERYTKVLWLLRRERDYLKEDLKMTDGDA